MSEPEDRTGQQEVKPEPAHDEASQGFELNEEIDLISDNEDEPTSNMRSKPKAKPVLKQTDEAASSVEPERTTSEHPVVEKNEESTAAPNPEQILAQQRRLANRFRSAVPQPAQLPDSQNSDPDLEPEEEDIERKLSEQVERLKALAKKYVLSIQDEVVLMKLEAELSAIQRKRAADAEFDATSEGDGLFVEQDDITPRITRVSSDDESERPRPKRGRKRKEADSDGDEQPGPRRRRLVLGQDYTNEDFEAIIKKSKAKAKSNKPGKKQTQPKTGSKVPKPEKAAARKQQNQTQITHLTSLMGTDVFRDATAVQHLDNQPQVMLAAKGPKRRDDVLKRLLASIPTESADIAKSDKRYLNSALKKFNGHNSISPATDGNWTLKGMRTTLKHYQVLGVAFMRDRENESHEPRGGILADEMGLGKTLMMLANIVNGMPPKKDNARSRTTLIVCSPALLTQWEQEIRTHCMSARESKHGVGRVSLHRPGNRLRDDEAEFVMKETDILLTTYQEVMKSYPKVVYPLEMTSSLQKAEYKKEVLEKDKGVLHKMKFLRVVLDEASAIKNHESHTSQACCALEAKHYWAISGTPIQNRIQEFYPYFKFLGEPTTGSYKIFKENYCNADDPLGLQRLNVVLHKLMIRRTHLTRMFNARLLDLPKPQEHTLWLDFNDVERQVYDIVRRRFIERINTMSRTTDSERKRFSHVWTMVLRLRQLCANVLLIFDSCLPLLEREDMERLNVITANEDDMSEEGRDLLIHLRHVIAESRDAETIEGGISGSVLTENAQHATGVVDVERTEGETGGKHGTSFRFRKYLDTFRRSEGWTEVVERSKCNGCGNPPYEPYVTSCSHIYCHGCLKDLMRLSSRRGHDHTKCSECGEAYTWSRPCEEGFEAIDARPTSVSSADGPVGKKGRKKDGNVPEEIDWLNLKGEVLPSAKTVALKAQVLEWMAEDERERIEKNMSKEDWTPVKTIIYTQWRPMIRILKQICHTEEWDFCTYSGDMSHESRSNAIEEFSNQKSKQILLCGLKCGGLGLNITSASRVLLIDPWWNQAVEQQAFCRVFRIGQQKETRMTRLVVRNTVDQAMMNIKDRKRIEIDEVMNSGPEKLSVPDLMRLFGNEVGEDGEGRPFIFADGEGPEEGTRRAIVEDDNEDMQNEA